MHRRIKFILFWNDTLGIRSGRSLRPSSGVQDCTYSNRHMSNRYCCRKFKTVHTATGICQTDTVWQLYVRSWTPDDGRKERPKHVECHSKIKEKKVDTLMHLVGFTIEIILRCTALWTSYSKICLIITVLCAIYVCVVLIINPLNTELNPICQ